MDVTFASASRSVLPVRSVAFTDWVDWQRQGFNHLPFAALLAGISPPSRWTNLAMRNPVVLLESGQVGRYSYFCDQAERVILGDADGAKITSGTGSSPAVERRGKPLAILHQLLEERKTPPLFPDWPAMSGGLLGAVGYDLVRTWEMLPRRADRDLDLPLYAFVEARELFVLDHQENTLAVMIWSRVTPEDPLRELFQRAEQEAAAASARWTQAASTNVAQEFPAAATAGSEVAAQAGSGHGPSLSFSAAAFESAVRRALEYIAAGDTYQVNLSLRSSRPAGVAAESIYEALRRINPSPYMGYMSVPGFALVCGSPELLVRLVDGEISSRPIAGTRRRGGLAEEDSSLSAELFASAKERAEHLMLVDLIRNDIGRVAAFGSVKVTEFMTLERYSHVMHIVSHVVGQLARNRTWADVLQSMFPGGTITGCPKVRTMEIIEELEPVGRGFYTGGLGWISYGGAMEMNIIIRSMLVKNGVAHVQAGAGIVADSQPHRELDEALRKAQALWTALAQAEAEANHGAHHG